MGASWSSKSRAEDTSVADPEAPAESACVTLESLDESLFAPTGEDGAAADAGALLARSGEPQKMLRLHLTGCVTVVASPTGDVLVLKGHN